jgi:multisubunit Na+/H+ antiporter MnhG subunit
LPLVTDGFAGFFLAPRFMIYTLSLKSAMLLVGLLLIIAHGIALVRTEDAKKWLQGFPRSREAGTVLIFIAAAWFVWLVTTMDLGEFDKWRRPLQIIAPVAAALLWYYVDEFLAVRALGMVVLLAAEPLLEAAWMRPELSRLLLVTYAYVGVTFALFWIGMPYTLRDQIAWVMRTPGRWRIAMIAGVVYGAALTLSSLTLHR